MRRSEINRLLREAAAFVAAHGVALPPWARWSPARWREEPDRAAYCANRQMGWDVTDFGSGRFAERGLVLFCLRNGLRGVAGERPYAEKLLIVREGQETPCHYHAAKMEDIIVRGGGVLVVEAFAVDRTGRLGDARVSVRTDGRLVECGPGEPICLTPGESITIPPRLAHRFYGESGSGTVLVGEVSQLNDDLTDNYFPAPVGRFAAIVEDEEPLYPLWNELSALAGRS